MHEDGLVRPAPPRTVGRGGAVRDHAGPLALLLGVAGLLAYSWWIPAVFVRHEVTSVNVLFSEMSADGGLHASVLQHLDVASGLLLLAALLLRGAPSRSVTAKRFHTCLLLFAVSAALGGVFHFACAPTLDHACHEAERHLDLPVHHYLHMVVGVMEFAGATGAVFFGALLPGAIGRIGRAGRIVLAVAYPLLAVAYLTLRFGLLAEPPFFVTFSAITACGLWAHRTEWPEQAGR